MGTETKKLRRKPRADSLRNRELLLQAAAEIFSAGGQQASLEAVARKAGVGIGTLYRHFPTREDLFEAVYRNEVDHLSDLARELIVQETPVEALRKWLYANVRLVSAKRGMIEGLQLVAYGSNELKAYSFERMTAAVGELLQGAVRAGELRSDISAEDLLRALLGIFYANSGSDWQPTALRLVDVFVEGLRVPKANASSH